jgi:hypothetical protein
LSTLPFMLAAWPSAKPSFVMPKNAPVAVFGVEGRTSGMTK